MSRGPAERADAGAVVAMRRRVIDVRGHPATYREADPIADSNDVVAILIAGLGLSSRFYERSCAAFAAAGIRLVVPDLPGRGGTPGARTGLNPAQTASFLLDFADAAGIGRAVWIGHSNGAQAATEMVVRAPDRALGLVLAGPTGAPGRLEAARQLAALAVETKRTSLDVIGAVTREYVRVSPISYFGTWLRHARHDMPALLQRVDCPALVLVGERDPVTTDSYIALIERLVPDIRIVRVPGATHALPRADPVAFDGAVIAFVRRVAIRR